MENGPIKKSLDLLIFGTFRLIYRGNFSVYGRQRKLSNGNGKSGVAEIAFSLLLDVAHIMWVSWNGVTDGCMRFIIFSRHPLVRKMLSHALQFDDSNNQFPEITVINYRFFAVRRVGHGGAGGAGDDEHVDVEDGQAEVR